MRKLPLHGRVRSVLSRLFPRHAAFALAGGVAIAALLTVMGEVRLFSASTFVVNDPIDRVDAFPGDGVCRTNAGTCSLRAAIQEANTTIEADVIQMPPGVFALMRVPTNENDITVGDLDITAPLTITGAPGRATIIDGGTAPFGAVEQTAVDRLFEIHGTAGAVTFSSLTLRNGWAPGDGGAIASVSRGAVRLIDVAVLNNVATGNGGGLYADGNEGGSLIIERSAIQDNSSGAMGGGVYVTRGQLTVSGTADAGVTISGNHAAGGGGGVYNAGERNLAGQQSRATITYATITGNQSGAAGGGVANEMEGVLTLTDALVTHNIAVAGGGGVKVGTKATASIVRGTFTDNLAGGEGGAFASESDRPVVIDQMMCTGNGAGGVRPGTEFVPGPDGTPIPRDTPILPDGELLEPADEGGGCLVFDGPGTVTITDSTIAGNNGYGDGGGISIHSFGIVRIADTVVRDNTTQRGGGGVWNSGMRVDLERVTIRNNTATLDGGGIENGSSGEFAIIDSNILSNTATNAGGLNIVADSTMRISGTTFWDNRAICLPEHELKECGRGAGIYHGSDGAFEVQNTTLSGNLAAQAGGGVYVDADAGLHLVHVTITRNAAPSGAGMGIPTEELGITLATALAPHKGVRFQNSLVAGNVGSDDCVVPFTTEGGNHDGGTRCGFVGPKDRTNVNVLATVLALADNGGPTMTHALTAASISVDAALSPCLLTDQRGVTRPKNLACDVGAYEFDGVPLPPDTTPPDTIIVSAPTTTDGGGVFEFAGLDNASAPGEFLFQCRIINFDPLEPPEPVDPTAPPPPLTQTPDPLLDWVSCASPWIIDPDGKIVGSVKYQLSSGSNQLLVRAIDRAGNVDPTPASHTWVDAADTVPPDTTILSAPPPVTSSRGAAFTFTGTDNLTAANLIEFECRIDGQDWGLIGECANPAIFSDLATGTHTFEVRALDGGDNIDPSPARYTWTILTATTCEDANLTLPAAADTWVDEFEAFVNYGIDLGLTVRSEGSEAGGTNARALVYFELPTDLPQCALQSATLRLFAQGGTEGRLIVARPIAAPWQENQVTWNTQPPTFNVGPRDDGQPSGSGAMFQEWDVTAAVAAMLSGGMPNYGFLMRDAAENDPQGAEQVFSSKDTIADSPQGPQLQLRFAPTDPNAPAPPRPAAPTVPTTVACGQTITESTLVGNDLIDCPAEGLVIGASNIMLDLGGHTIDGLNYMAPVPGQPLPPGAVYAGQEEGLPAGIRNSGFTNVVITNGTVQEFGTGVHLTAGTTYNVLEFLTLARNSIAGVDLVNADNGRIGNEIRDNYFVGNADALGLRLGSEGSAVYRNRFEGNSGFAMYMSDVSGHRIESNHISGYTSNPLLSDSDGGFRVEGSRNNLFRGNSVFHTGDAGFYLTLGSHNNLIDGNAMSHAGDAGVYIQDSNGNHVINNIVHRSSDSGINVAASRDTLVRGNDVRWNPSGVTVGGGSNNLIEANDATHSSQSGFEFGGGATGLRALRNVANVTGGDGITIESEVLDANGTPVPGVLLEGNTSNQNLSVGISVQGLGHTVTANDAHNNALYGISAEGSIDGGGNRASGNNQDLEQCLGVVCETTAIVPLIAPDLGRPDTFITVAPPNGASTLAPQLFEFTGIDNYAPLTALNFSCRLDAPADPPAPPQDPNEPPSPPPSEGWVSCVSPLAFEGLSAGTHTFQVRAEDPAHNVDWEPATYTWTVSPTTPGVFDTAPPDTVITNGPVDGTSSTTATITFAGSDNESPGYQLEYECRIDDGAFTACTNPVTYTGLSIGTHTVQVRALDLGGNVDGTPASYTWTIVLGAPDVTAPETTITARPDPVTVSTAATFSFTSSESGSMFLCSLDGGALTSCTSPHTISGLAPGQHTFAVRAVDAAGNLDPTPAMATWQVSAPPVAATVTCGEVLLTSVILQNDLLECPEYGLVIGADGLTVDLNGFTIDGRGSSGTGILTQGYDYVTISNGTIQEFNFGVRLTPGTSGAIVSALRIFSSQLAAIELSDADGNTVRDNVLVANGTGIAMLNGTQGTLVSGNIVGSASGDGIHVGGRSAANTISGNEVSTSGGAGIALEGVSQNTVSANLLTANSGEAIAVHSTVDPIDAVIVYPANNNRITGNIVLTGSGGIVVAGVPGGAAAQGNEVTSNTVDEVSGAGISLENATATLVRGNLTRYSSVGIALSASTDNRIEGNEAVDAMGAGISLGSGSLGNVVFGNGAVGNGESGIQVLDQAAGNGNVIERNQSYSNTGNGIYVPGTGHSITANTADHNFGWGIWVELGNVDGGGNNAFGNDGGPVDPATGHLVQCYNIACGNTALLDVLTPETMISAGPANPTTTTEASFAFSGLDALTPVTDLSYQCRLDSQLDTDFAACTSPQSYTGLSAGTHTFEVRAVDQQGNVDPTPATYTWAITPPGVAPETTILSGPDPSTVNTTATFTFTSNEPGATFACALDGSALAPCASPQSYSVTEGPHTFAVAATDLEGLTDETPALHAWSVGIPAVPAQVSCGQVLTQSTLVLNDLIDCPADGLIIGAHGITLDLNGHLVDGVGSGVGIRNPGFDNVTITDGSVSGGVRDTVPVPAEITTGVQQFETGVFLSGSATGNIVSALQVTSTSVIGILLSDADDATVRGNSLFGNGTGIALLDGTQNALVLRNTITAGLGEGIRVAGSHNNRLENNRISDSTGLAIVLDFARDNIVTGNTVSNNQGVAVEILNTSNGNVIDRNMLTGNAAGVHIYMSDGVQVTVNVIQQNLGAGVSLEQANNTLVRGNDLRFNQAGITLVDSSNNRLESNIAGNSTGNGVSIDGNSASNVLVSNMANGNTGDGIAVGAPGLAGAGTLIERNTASGNGGDGIQVSAPVHTITANTADSNGGWGIFAEVANIDGGGNRATGNLEPAQCYTVVCEATTHPGQPDTTIVEHPADPSNSRYATLTFTGTDDVNAPWEMTYQCRFDSTDPAAWETQVCENPTIFSNLSEGSHTFEVRAIDVQGNIDPTPASYTWTIALLPSGVAPDTTIISGPGVVSPLFEATFIFSANEPDVTFQCSIDGGSFAPCGFLDPSLPPSSTAGALFQFLEHEIGPHVFQVRAIDLEGNVDPTPATYEWSILGIWTTITSGPAYIAPTDPAEFPTGGETDSPVAMFTFTASVPGATFECSIDLQPFLPCVSGVTYTGLGPGAHLFRIIATDANGNTSVEPIEYGWDVVPSLDTAPPETIMTVVPVNNTSDVMFQFTGTDNMTPTVRLLYECRLDSTLNTAWVSCISPFNLFEAFPLIAPGQHTFEVRAIDEGLGGTGTQTPTDNIDPTPATHTWTYAADTTAPETAIVTGPPASGTLDATVEFTFAGNDGNATPALLLTFECAVDGAAFAPCASPLSVTVAGVGTHTLQVRAVDQALNADPTPATYPWILFVAPVAVIESAPAPTTADATATFTFSADQAGASFGCSIDGGPFVTCTSPATYLDLVAGPHVFAVRAADAAGNAGEPVSYQWMVEGTDVTAPDTIITTGPTLVTGSSRATFVFSATEPNATFQCALDGAIPNTCIAPLNYQDLVTGTHTFTVYAVDWSGNPDPTPASYTWTIAGPGAAPETTIDLGPLDLGPTQLGALENTTSTTAAFSFSSDTAGATFACIIGILNPVTQLVEFGQWTPCSSPHLYVGLLPGTYEFQVRATSPAGITDPTPADYNWDIVSPDLAAPRTSLDNGPAALTELADATFEFSAFDGVTGEPEPLATFECSLDGAPFAECFSPATYTGLAVGSHTFAVRATDALGNVDATPESYTWFVDALSGPPDTIILSGPPAVTASSEAAFTFSSNSTEVTFECTLDGGAPESCGAAVLGPNGTPLYYTEELGSLQPGPHTLEVRAIHTTLGPDTTPATYSWTMDPAERIAPNTTIVSRPAALTVASSAEFAFVADEAATFECSLDGLPYAGCSSPVEYVQLSEGAHTFQVRAIDQVLNVDPTPASFTWTIIGVADQVNTMITSGPASVTATTSATFTFTATAAPATFECALDGAGFALCTSPVSLEALSDGFHTFQVIATDALGNEDPTPASYTWTIQTQPGTVILDTAILSGPTLTTTSTSATFELQSVLGTAFECALDGAAFAACTSPASYAGLALGTHTFDVRALDASGTADPTPARYGWTILADTTLLDTQILSGPTLSTTSTSATFNVSSNRAATFECALDAAPFAACTAPVSYSDLAVGSHMFRVRAVDTAGVVDATPATYTWTVDAAGIALTTTIQSGPAAVTASTDAIFAFASADPLATLFECAIDGGAFEGCVSPAVYNDLLEGAHQFQVRAIDEALNVGPTASYAWTIQLDTTGPVTTLLAGPAAISGSPDAAFSFSATDPLATFECSLDGLPFEACDLPAVYGDLLPGEHTFQVRAVNEALVTGAPVSYTWTVVSEPETTILVAPASPSGSDTATFVFSSDQPATFQCSLNGAPFASCVSPFEARGLIDGTQEFEIQATNTYGFADQTPAVHTWTVTLPPDVTAPETVISVGPSGVNASVTVLFEFAGTDNRTPVLDLAFECSLDGEPFLSCSSPHTLDLISALTDLELPGEHTLAVRAVDLAGNADATPATRTWTFLDVTAPETTILSGPPSETEATTATFSFEVSVPEPGVRFECSLDGFAFAACTSPYTVSGLAAGTHIFQVRAIDAAGNIESMLEVFTWIIDPSLDTVPPDTVIVAGPPATTAATQATFVFVATEFNTTFECALDGGIFSACDSPYDLTVAPGAHTLQVRAVDAGNHTDASPASYSWTVIGAPDTAIVSGPASPSGAATATFTFSSPEPSATFQCFLDGDGPTPCTSPWVVVGLLEGPHEFEVQALVTLGVVDGLPASTVDPTPAVYTWEVGLPPETTIVSMTPLPGVPGESPILQFLFTGTDDLTPPLDLSYECSIDNGAFEGCSTPYELETVDLAEGTHTLAVRALDSAGHVDPTEATISFTAGGVPETSVTSGPAAQSEATEATFTFASTQANVTFECSLDLAQPFVACTSPVTFTDLPHGEHQLDVRAVNAAGIIDESPASYSWQTGDMTPPVVTIISGPAGEADALGVAGSTELTTATFAFTIDDPASLALCTLDGGAPQFCTSPVTYIGLLPGARSFEVQPDKANLLVEAIAATYAWEILDIAAPDTQIVSGPAALGTATTASFIFTGTDNAPVADLDFECALDGAAFSGCASPLELTALALGEHTLLVRATDASLNADATPADYTWTVVSDATAPETTIVSGPALVSLAIDAAFTFSGSDATSPAEALTYECSLDGAMFELCGSPEAISGLAVGTHTFEVRAIDEAGNVDGTPASHTFTVEQAPETVIDAGPAAISDTADATFVFSATDNGAAPLTFQCSLDGAAFAVCSSPVQLTGLSSGNHTFAVRAVDSAGFADATAATYDWSISAAADTIAPETSMTSAPSGTTTATDATFTFTATEANSTFECALNAAAFAACSSPSTLAGLAGGTHTFAVRAVDAAGNTDASPASATWTIGVPPETVILTGPLDGPGGIILEATGATSATLTFEASEAGSTFECALDFGTFAPCTSPVTYTGLAEGLHEVRVRATGSAGLTDATPDDYEWLIDLTPPTTGIVEQPPATSTVTSATFTAASNDPGATFECSLDAAPFAPCAQTVSYTSLSHGPHTWSVRAIDATGNVDQTPASYTWTIAPLDTTAPDTTITSAPTASTIATSATFSFETNEPDTTFECSLDGGAYGACTSPASYSNLSLGEHTFAVRAIDAVGNIDASPASSSWTVAPINCGAPVTLSAIADAWIDQGSPSQNKGDDSSLQVRSKNGSANARALINFSLPQAPQGCAVQSATLRVESMSAVNGRTLRAMRVAAAWAENAVTWSNQPAAAGTVATSPSAASGTGLRAWTVTTLVQEMYSLNAAHGFLIRDGSEGAAAGPEQSLSSREGAVAPQLVITFGPQ